MPNEASIRTSLQILKGKLDYQSRPTTFTTNIDAANPSGPSPGAITISVLGTDVDLSELNNPSLCRIQNLDATNFLEYGIWDPESSTFYPLGECLKGESYVLRLSRNIQEEFGTGTGTTGADTNRLRLKADTASVEALVECFEK